MKVEFAGRGVDITDRIRNFTEAKLDRLKKHLDDMQDMSVVLSVEKYRHRAEIKFKSLRRSFHGTEETSDMFQSIDRVIDKLEAQVRKVKEKNTAKRRNTTESIRHNGNEVLAAVEDADGDRDGDGPQIIRNETVAQMSLDDAVEALQESQTGFVIYRDSESDHINVVYRRKDGHVGLIDPRT